METDRIIEQVLREDGIWTMFESGLQIMRPYLKDADGNEYAELFPNELNG